MEFRSYVRVLRRRWLVIAICAVLAAGTAYAYAAPAPRIYRATAHLSVTPSVVDFFTGEAVQRLLNNYALQLRSRAFASDVARWLPASAGNVAGKIRAVAAPAEYRIGIEVDDTDPQVAQMIANAAADAFVARIRADIAGKERHDIAIDILDHAEVPGSPVSPRPKRDALGAGIAGAMIGAAAALLLEFLDDTIKTADEAASLLGLPVLGTLPRVTKAKH